ncbi:MAG: fasciclin domain-containing protein [Balneolaceae bacterium]|nr:fasciclin domain-containing protein [Balneolaceae bacterium]
MKSVTVTLSALALGVLLLAFAPAKTAQTDHHNTIVNLAAGTDNLSTLVTAIKAADLVETLNGDGPFTVFAPTNAAFAKLPDGTVESLLKPENKDQLTRILTYHVVPGKVMSGDLEDGMTAKTVQGDEIEISLGANVMINDATVESADIEASNGVVHLIDSVIMPPEKSSSSTGY